MNNLTGCSCGGTHSPQEFLDVDGSAKSPQILTQLAELTGNLSKPGIVTLYITAPDHYAAFLAFITMVLASALCTDRHPMNSIVE